jgi:hypothetical protein
MEKRILIVTNKKSNFYNSLIYLFEQEQIDYVLADNINSIDKTITNIIYLDNSNTDLLVNVNIPIIFVSSSKKIISSAKINYIITKLLDDDTEYTDVQKEYLFKKGLYNMIFKKINELINNYDNLNGLIIDTTECVSVPIDWIFNFDSITETYLWISKKNKVSSQKVINFYYEKVYSDSSNEIDYLTEKLINIESGESIIDIFVCTKEELESWRKNHFFKTLLSAISNTYKIYIIDKNNLKEKEPLLIEDLLDGIIIYDDCIYRDTYNDEYSLGYVDCKISSVDKYNKYFDYIINTYGTEINRGSDIDAI